MSIHTQKGAALLTAVLFFTFITVGIILGAIGPAVVQFQSAREAVESKSSYALAESGVEDVFYRVKNGMNYSTSETVPVNGDTIDITIVETSNEKQITAVGDIDSSIRKVRTVMRTSVVGSSFNYGAQVGEGGLVMQENTEVTGASGSNGNVYSNGPITGAGSNKSTITGDAIVASSLTEDVQARSTVCNTDQVVGNNDPEIDFAQSFVPSNSEPLAKLSLYIKKNSNPSSVPVRIVADNGGVPDTTTIASATLNRDLVGSNYAWIDIVFSTPPTLTAGTTYWIVLDADQHNNKYWTWCKDSNNGFGNGVAKYSEDWDNDPWTGITGDLTFKTYFGAGVNAITDVRVNGDAKANTITDSFIGGDAYYQSISGTTVQGTSHPGSADPAPLALPISNANIADWKSDAADGGVIAGSCPGTTGCGTSMGPVKIDGDLEVVGGTTLTITGTIYVTGDILVDNNSTVQCDSGYGDKSCVILADGNIEVSNNGIFQGSGHADSYVMALTTITTCDGGTQQSECAPNNSGIYLTNNVTGAIFYAPESRIFLTNNVDVTTVVGDSVELNNNATITYEIGVANLSFSSGPGGGWKTKQWEEVD